MFGITADYNNGYSRGQADLRFWTNREIAGLNQALGEWRAYARRLESERNAANARADNALHELQAQSWESERSTTIIGQLRADFVTLNERTQADSRKTNEMMVSHQQRLGELNNAITALVAERAVLTQHVTELLGIIQMLDPNSEIQAFRWQEIEIDRDVALAKHNMLASALRRVVDALPSPADLPATDRSA